LEAGTLPGDHGGHSDGGRVIVWETVTVLFDLDKALPNKLGRGSITMTIVIFSHTGTPYNERTIDFNICLPNVIFSRS
jgi:hypothetical protein